jgi:hypothetical protein
MRPGRLMTARCPTGRLHRRARLETLRVTQQRHSLMVGASLRQRPQPRSLQKRHAKSSQGQWPNQRLLNGPAVRSGQVNSSLRVETSP